MNKYIICLSDILIQTSPASCVEFLAMVYMNYMPTVIQTFSKFQADP